MELRLNKISKVQGDWHGLSADLANDALFAD